MFLGNCSLIVQLADYHTQERQSPQPKALQLVENNILAG